MDNNHANEAQPWGAGKNTVIARSSWCNNILAANYESLNLEESGSLPLLMFTSVRKYVTPTEAFAQYV